MNIQPLSYGYTPVGDFIALTLCIANFFFLRGTYSPKQKNMRLFYMANIDLILICLSSILYFSSLKEPNANYYFLICTYGIVRRLSLLVIFVIFDQYIFNLLLIRGSARLIFDTISYGIFFAIFSCVFITSITTDNLVYIGLDFAVHNPLTQIFFALEYVLNMLLVTAALLRYRKRIIAKIRLCLSCVVLLSFFIMVGGVFRRTSVFVGLFFYLPIVGALFMFHHNTYDANTGCLDRNIFKRYLPEICNRDFYILFLTLKEYETENWDAFDEYLYFFNENFFHSTYTFHITETRVLVAIPAKKNPDFWGEFERMMADFMPLYETYRNPYKWMCMKVDSRLSEAKDFFDFLSMREDAMAWNSIQQIEAADFDAFVKSLEVRNLLRDIVQNRNLDDERVKVYCQPVLNTRTGAFTTAEALMRIESPDMGMLYPDTFIPIAERNNYIHTFSMIILHKCCKQIQLLESQGYFIERISVNFSIMELRSKSFCRDVIEIIRNVGITPSKIAIELTESRNDADFAVVKSIMEQLGSIGIKFYLDDFGTGYSNFDRIIELPIDIIKFDRSLTIMAGSNAMGKFMVESFSKIFVQSHYEILFEGIENADDEALCKEMHAGYLQGYKYSKPIPISQLTGFLGKA